jgi:hypothetical protein|tara:strand:- start:924 stop:1151 length:228 start_codon:yes stop_codon:yes gene_type:complete
MEKIGSIREVARVQSEANVVAARLLGARVSDIQGIKRDNLEDVLIRLSGTQFKSSGGSIPTNKMLFQASQSAEAA